MSTWFTHFGVSFSSVISLRVFSLLLLLLFSLIRFTFACHIHSHSSTVLLLSQLGIKYILNFKHHVLLLLFFPSCIHTHTSIRTHRIFFLSNVWRVSLFSLALFVCTKCKYKFHTKHTHNITNFVCDNSNVSKASWCTRPRQKLSNT